MPKYGKAAGKSVESAMHREKRGTLMSGKGGKGGKVTSRKQAIAIFSGAGTGKAIASRRNNIAPQANARQSPDAIVRIALGIGRLLASGSGASATMAMSSQNDAESREASSLASVAFGKDWDDIWANRALERCALSVPVAGRLAKRRARVPRFWKNGWLAEP